MKPDEASPVVLALVLGVPLLAVWAVALADVLRREDRDFPPMDLAVPPRVFWTFVVIFLSAIGSLYYYFAVMRFRPRRRR